MVDHCGLLSMTSVMVDLWLHSQRQTYNRLIIDDKLFFIFTVLIGVNNLLRVITLTRPKPPDPRSFTAVSQGAVV